MPEENQTRPCCRDAGRIVIGVDEVGVGSLIGCVTSAAVILDVMIEGLADSKKISERKRVRFAELIKGSCRHAIAHATLEEVNSLGIRAATMLAMERAIDRLAGPYDALVIVDGTALPERRRHEMVAVTKADATCPTVSAASILAKTARDAIVAELAAADARYDWASNMGYGTAKHIAAIQQHGPSAHHRTEFNPVRQMLRNIA